MPGAELGEMSYARLQGAKRDSTNEEPRFFGRIPESILDGGGERVLEKCRGTREVKGAGKVGGFVAQGQGGG